MKKQYEGMKAEKVEFDYEENVVASGNGNWTYQPGCGTWDGNLEILNTAKCACTWKPNSNQK